jgi:hypothetical protein
VLSALQAAKLGDIAGRAEQWLREAAVDGLWRGRWFKGELYSTLSALEVIDTTRVDLARTRARVVELRNGDGGFGSPGHSTIEETAWGAGVLLETGGEGIALAEPSIAWLAERYEHPVPAHVGALPLFAKFYSDSVLPAAFMLWTFNTYLQLKGVRS